HHRASLQGGIVSLLRGGNVIHSWGARGENEQYATAKAQAGDGVEITVSLPLPLQYSKSLSSIEKSQRGYFELKQQQRQLRRFYMQMLMLLTALTLFAATWLSVFIARLVTRPVSALAEATQQIRAGHLGYRVEVSAADELGELVASFNQMAGELEQNRQH